MYTARAHATCNEQNELKVKQTGTKFDEETSGANAGCGRREGKKRSVRNVPTC